MKDTWHSDGLYIGGTWNRTHSPDRIDVVSPNTGVVLGSVPLADSTDVNLAVRAAKAAFAAWSERKPHERAAVMLRLADATRFFSYCPFLHG